MSEILKNTLIAELIWLAGAATQTFAPGGKHHHDATEQYALVRTNGRAIAMMFVRLSVWDGRALW